MASFQVACQKPTIGSSADAFELQPGSIRIAIAASKPALLNRPIPFFSPHMMFAPCIGSRPPKFPLRTGTQTAPVDVNQTLKRKGGTFHVPTWDVKKESGAVRAEGVSGHR